MFDLKVKILIIDDRPENLHAIKMTLQPLKEVEIHTAQSGNEGLSLMLDHDFAVVLLDVQMPGMDGFETAALMQNHKATANVPIIFVTAISKEQEHVFKGYQRGAVDYLFKPLNPDILLSKVKVFVKLYQQRRECERMQQELQKSKNLESLGVLAGGIAHDFNNLLTTIFGYIEMAQAQCEPESEINLKLNEAIKAAVRASKLTQQLLTFSKGGQPIKECADIAGLITDTASLLLSGSKVRVHYDLAASVDELEVDKSQICQVFQNLLFNAKEAMPEGGNLIIRTENVLLEEGCQEPPVKEGGRYVKITFQDDGPGIEPQIIGKIFDPYYSTKSRGATRGQGLGLTIAYSIVKKHGGYLRVESTQGKGAAFHIYLPAVSTKSRLSIRGAAPAISSAAPPGLRNMQGRILVMEDEESVAETFKEMLGHLGYETTVAADGTQAIALYTEARNAKRPFAVLILDLTIRGGEGAEKVLARLREQDPTIKALVASGYADNYIMANYKNFGFSGSLSKPFSLQTLAIAVERLL